MFSYFLNEGNAAQATMMHSSYWSKTGGMKDCVQNICTS